MQALGAALRERREAMGVTLAEVEVATRIRQKYLAAIEADEWHLLPGEVVGRGFLRNYADYLGLEPNEVMERRRAVTDSNLNAALSTTSAGAPLPPERDVDYRPKEVELKDETDEVEQGEIRLAPILAIVALAVLVGLGWWGINALGAPLGEMLAGSQTRVAGLFERAEPEAAGVVVGDPGEDLGVVNEQNQPDDAGAAVTDTLPAVVTPGTIILGSGAEAGGEAGGEPAADQPLADQPAAEQPAGDAPPPADAGSEPAAGSLPVADPALAALVPTNTPDLSAAIAPTEAVTSAVDAPAVVPELPAATPEAAAPEAPTPEPPTPTPEALPTETPTPEPPTPEPPPPVAAASCADGRAVISAPGAGQTVAGMVGVSGTAQHEAFQYYKLEYAPGAWAAGGYVYFDGSNSQVIGGLLGNLDTGALPNGDYTIRLTVVDQTSNYPPPCDVAIVVQN